MFASFNCSWDVTLLRSKNSSRLFLEGLLVNSLLCLQLHFMQDPSKSPLRELDGFFFLQHDTKRWLKVRTTWVIFVHLRILLCTSVIKATKLWVKLQSNSYPMLFFAGVFSCRQKLAPSIFLLFFFYWVGGICQNFKYECLSPLEILTTSIDPDDFLEIVEWGGMKIIE